MGDGGTVTQLQFQEGVPDISQVNEAFITQILAVREVQTVHSLQTNWDSTETSILIQCSDNIVCFLQCKKYIMYDLDTADIISQLKSTLPDILFFY